MELPPSLSRRSVLKAGAALAASPLFGLVPDTFSFAFFSDTHVGLEHGLKEDAEMFREMAAMPLAFAINAGDITDYGWVEEYANYRSLIKGLPFKVHHAPGNHDVRWSPLGPQAYLQGTGDPMYGSFDHQGVHFVMLNSTIPLSHYGHFESEMLRWLAEDLKKVGREKPVFLAFHHWVGREGIQVDNEAELFKLIEPYNVKILLNGHGHSDLLWTTNGIHSVMNKGLYQRSWSLVEVGRNEVRLSRRTQEAPTQTSLLTVPLASDREKRPVWSLTPVGFGHPVAVPSGFGEARWDDGKWVFLAGDVAETIGLLPGTHRLTLRRDANTYVTGGALNVPPIKSKLQPAWQRKLSGGIMSHLRLVDGVLYVSAMDGSVWALESDTGKPLWTAQTKGYCHSSPLVTPNLVIVGSADGSVHAFDRKEGRPVWKFATHGPVYASGVEAKGIVAIGSGDGTIYGLDLATGALRWQYALPASRTAFTQSVPATDGERFYFGAWDKHLYALDAASGQLVWSRDCCGTQTWPYSPAIGGPVAGNGMVYVPTDGNVLWAFKAASGEPVWQAKSPGEKFGYSAPCLVGDRIYIGCLGDFDGEARCVSALNGKILWTATTGSAIYDSSFCHADGVVTIGSVCNLLSSISAADGRILAQYRLPVGHVLASPVAENGRIYAASFSDCVTAFTLR